jgi:hypothetical protein
MVDLLIYCTILHKISHHIRCNKLNCPRVMQPLAVGHRPLWILIRLWRPAKAVMWFRKKWAQFVLCWTFEKKVNFIRISQLPHEWVFDYFMEILIQYVIDKLECRMLVVTGSQLFCSGSISVVLGFHAGQPELKSTHACQRASHRSADRQQCKSLWTDTQSKGSYTQSCNCRACTNPSARRYCLLS